MNINPANVHHLKNQLAIILGFCELILEDCPDTDQRRADLLQIQAAAKSALGELPPLPANEFGTLDRTPETHDAD